MKYVLCCVDGGVYSKDIGRYATFIANNLNLPLKLFNVVEHNHNSKSINLSGNIKLGEKDDILENLTKQEALESINNIKRGKEILKNLKEELKPFCKNEIFTLQVHGDLLENIQDLEDESHLLILGIHSRGTEYFGEHTLNIIKATKNPILLVNNHYKEINKVLVAYNGSKESKKLFDSTSKNPILGKEVHRTIINLNKDEKKSQELLKQAQEIYTQKQMSADTISLRDENPLQIVEYFDKNQYDILAMGAYGHSFLKELLFGSFTNKILENIKKPILLFR